MPAGQRDETNEDMMNSNWNAIALYRPQEWLATLPSAIRRKASRASGASNAQRSPLCIALCVMVALLLAIATHSAQAVPSFARQTGLECMSCHVSWPELTPTGRQFKLNGYTLGDRLRLPMAGMLQVSRTSTSNVDPRASDSFPSDKDVVLQQASIFMSGKISEHLGAFSQWTYDGVAHHSSIDNVDLRYAGRTDMARHSIIYGATLHNNPMVQDIFNTGQAWGFPYTTSPVAIAPNAATIIESLAQQVVGVGAYTLWDNTVYGEVTAYRTADRAFSFLRAGTDRSSDAALKGNNPYWRLALQHDWSEGKYSAMLGAYGLTVDRYPDNINPSGPTDRFRDTGVDAQYQYITDQHRITMQLNYLREKQDWFATALSNASDTLRSFKAKGTYYYQTKYGFNLAHFSTKGSADGALYNTGSPTSGSISGSPDSAGTIWELNYLPRRDIRLLLQYTAYSKFNGAKTNYDGFGRNAKDNNTLLLMAWLMF